MIFGGLEFLLPTLLSVLFTAALVVTIITISSIVETTAEELNSRAGDDITVINPSVNADLAAAARQALASSGKKHARVTYNARTDKAALVQSNRVSSHIANNDLIDVRLT